ncbi:hypothetical protein [Burkholderia cepacia]|uniref:hypothetical protein n=1 Tax=Burkholderia cepacia TaxID=292 RepID=UPI0018B0BEF6|nr:hypothetical protein [Burkholderia cepacia]
MKTERHRRHLRRLVLTRRTLSLRSAELRGEQSLYVLQDSLENGRKIIGLTGLAAMNQCAHRNRIGILDRNHHASMTERPALTAGMRIGSMDIPMLKD